jgi:uncharacterized membrane protein YgcG
MRTFVRVLAIVLLAAVAWAQEDDERILAYHSDITVQADASLLVHETIRVRAQGDQIKHGIYRDFPTQYRDQWGNHFNVRFTVMAADRDGTTEKWHTESLSNGVRVYLGDKDSLVKTGEHTYVLTYAVTREIGFFPDHDELYWNVTGNGWAFPIDQASATVHLPAAVPRSALKLEGYTGNQGSQEKAFTTATGDSGDPTFTATRPFDAHEGLTIVVAFPKGYLPEPTREQKTHDFLEDNRAVLAGLGGFAIVFLYYFIVWVAVGRDPAAGTIMPLYEPPQGFSPAAVRFLRKMSFDDKTFAAAVIDLAVKKQLTIRQDDGVYSVAPTSEPYASDLSAEEKVLRAKLLGAGAELRLARTNWQTVSSAVKGVKSALEGALEKIYFFSNGKYTIPGIVLTVVSIIALVAALPVVQDKMAAAFLCVWLTGWTVGVIALLTNAIRQWRHASGIFDVLGALFISAFAVPFVAAEIFVLFMLSRSVSTAGALVMFAVIALNPIFHQLLKAPTRAGRKVLDQIDGFRMFLAATEEDVLNRMNPPQRTPATFEKYLPYAVALDCEQAWGAQFAGILAAAGQAPGQYSPAWYSGAAFAASGLGGFASSFSSGLSSAISSSSTAPGSSSGSGGGGSSGGGGGGGGGGGW